MENALYLRTNIRIPMQIEALKLNLIKKIMEVDDPSSLAAIEAAISGFHRRDDEDVLRKLAKPIKCNTTDYRSGLRPFEWGLL